MAKKYLFIASMTFFISLLFSISVMTASYAANVVKQVALLIMKLPIINTNFIWPEGAFLFPKGILIQP